MTRKEAESYRAKIEMAAALMSDEAALDSIELIAPWRIKESVSAGERRRFDGVLYKCVQVRTSAYDASRLDARYNACTLGRCKYRGIPGMGTTNRRA